MVTKSSLGKNVEVEESPLWPALWIVLSLSLGVGLTVGMIKGLVRERQALSWPSTTGKVVQWHFDKEDSDWTIIYEYQVESQLYRSSRIGIMGVSVNGSERDLWPEGRELRVYYDPAEPSFAMLRRGESSSVFLLVPLILLFFGIAVVQFGRHGERIFCQETRLRYKLDAFIISNLLAFALGFGWAICKPPGFGGLLFYIFLVPVPFVLLAISPVREKAGVATCCLVPFAFICGQYALHWVS